MQLLAVHLPKAQLTDTGRIDEQNVAESVKPGTGGRMPAAGVAPAHLAGSRVVLRRQSVEKRRLPDPAVPDQNCSAVVASGCTCSGACGTSGEGGAKALDSPAARGRATHSSDAHGVVWGQNCEHLIELVLADQVDLVDDDQRHCAATLGGDEKAIDERRPQRRPLHRNHDADDVDVGRDHPLPAWIAGIGPGQDGPPRKDLQDSVPVAVRYDQGLVAHRDGPLLLGGEPRRQDGGKNLAVTVDNAGSGRQTNDDPAPARGAVGRLQSLPRLGGSGTGLRRPAGDLGVLCLVVAAELSRKLQELTRGRTW